MIPNWKRFQDLPQMVRLYTAYQEAVKEYDSLYPAPPVARDRDKLFVLMMKAARGYLKPDEATAVIYVAEEGLFLCS